MRVCSLLPSATEIVCALGLGDQLVAVTHECDFPPQITRLPRITRSLLDHSGQSSREIDNHIARAVHEGSGIYSLDRDLLQHLDPDLILTQELCDVCAVSYRTVREAVRLLEGPRQVLSLEPTNLSQILETIVQVGEMMGVRERSQQLKAELRQRIDQIASTAAQPGGRPGVFAMEWLDPPFVGGHWVPEMIHLAGGRDLLGQENSPSFTASWEEIAASSPDLVILMPCGLDLEQTLDEFHRTPLPAEWQDLPAVRSGQVYAVNGSAYFNRPGPRIVEGLEILSEIIHPNLFPRRSPPDRWSLVSSVRNTQA